MDLLEKNVSDQQAAEHEEQPKRHMRTVVPISSEVGPGEKIGKTQKKYVLPKPDPTWKLLPKSFLLTLFPTMSVLKTSDCYPGFSD